MRWIYIAKLLGGGLSERAKGKKKEKTKKKKKGRVKKEKKRRKKEGKKGKKKSQNSLNQIMFSNFPQCRVASRYVILANGKNFKCASENL